MTPQKKGSILIYMLGVIALLSIIVTQFLLETAEAIRYRSQITQRNDLQYLAYSALETTLAVLDEINLTDKGLFAPSQGWATPLQYAKFPTPPDYFIDVKINDETGKLSIYNENTDILIKLLSDQGFSYEQISGLKTGLQSWLSKPTKLIIKPEKSQQPKEKEIKNSPENKPEDKNQPKPKSDKSENKKEKKENKKEDKKEQRIMFNLLQLKEIPAFETLFFTQQGLPNDHFNQLKELITILYDGVPNINTSPEPIKKVLLANLHPTNPSGDKETFYRSMADLGLKDDVANEREKLFGFKVIVLNITIQVQRGPIKYFLNAIVKINDQPKTQKSNENQTPTQVQTMNTTKNKSNFTLLALTEDNIYDR